MPNIIVKSHTTVNDGLSGASKSRTLTMFSILSANDLTDIKIQYPICQEGCTALDISTGDLYEYRNEDWIKVGG